MGTTITALLLRRQQAGLAHIGDSRGYLLRDGELHPDHPRPHASCRRLVDEGRITAEEAEHHPQRSVITRVLDGRADDEPDLSVREARVGDRYLVCSDGLTAVGPRRHPAEALAAHDDPAGGADRLVELALRGGGPDNVTCIVAHVVDLVAAAGRLARGRRVRRGARHRHQPATPPTPAAKAAALARDGRAEPDDATTPGPSTRRRRPVGAARRARLLVLAVLAGGGYAAYCWSQQQYYVGVDGRAASRSSVGCRRTSARCDLSSVDERARRAGRAQLPE